MDTDSSQQNSTRRLDQLETLRPRTAEQVNRFVQTVFGLNIGPSVIDPGSTPPLAYLVHAFFECGDAVVWANRGGGKTLLGAVATMLDLIFKPGIQIRILGGSLEQSAKMYAHLLRLLDRPALRNGGGVLAGPPTQRRIELANRSVVELLAQSHRSVRGTRVHKLRCDEVEEFQSDVWQAAQLVTQSGMCGDQFVRGSVEALSTAHRPHGLMSELIQKSRPAQEAHQPILPLAKLTPLASKNFDTTPGAIRMTPRLFRWNALDVIARCPPQRPCESCVLWSQCQGRAKRANGFISVDDLVAQHERTDQQTWESEILCHRPTRRHSVYPNFEAKLHIRETTRLDDSKIKDTRQSQSGERGSVQSIGGMDFGVRSPTVFLWASIGPTAGEDSLHDDPSASDMAVHVLDEYIEPGRTLDEHLDRIEARAAEAGHPTPRWLGVDPAGGARNAHSGLSDLQVLRRRGYLVRARSSRITDGIRLVRRRLDRRTLAIHPRCTRLIEALRTYHFDPNRPERDEPVKDGPDHACDALRYLLVNLEQAEPAIVSAYVY